MPQARSLKRVVLYAALIGVAGCAAIRAERFIETDISPGGNLQNELALAYQEAAKEHADLRDWRGSKNFAHKGAQALEGNTPAPGKPSKGGLLEKDANQLAKARQQLLIALDRPQNASACAEAQVNYDRWLSRASSNTYGPGGYRVGGSGGSANPAMTAQASKSFSASMAKCSGVRMADLYDDDSVAGDDSMAIDLTGTTIVAERTVYFAFNSARLDDFAEDTVREINDMTAEGYDVFAVEVTGYTDTTGPSAYNVALGRQRARTVRSRLRALGVANVQVFSRGESDLAVPTGDDVREPLNRRASIVVRAR